jgi:hypothetical protein
MENARTKRPRPLADMTRIAGKSVQEQTWLGIQSPYGKVLFEGEKQQLADTRAR